MIMKCGIEMEGCNCNNECAECQANVLIENKCLICGRELPPDMTQLIITIGEYKYQSVCLQHEGSKELKELLKGTQTHECD